MLCWSTEMSPTRSLGERIQGGSDVFRYPPAVTFSARYLSEYSGLHEMTNCPIGNRLTDPESALDQRRVNCWLSKE